VIRRPARSAPGVLLLVLVTGVLVAGELAAEPRWWSSRRILRRATGVVEVVPIDDYVAAVLPAEIGNAPQAALEAQAVAARSFALARWSRHGDENADLCDGTHCQVYRGIASATPASRKAAYATRGLVLVQGGRIVGAPFHASCGGRTTRPVEVWDDEEMPDIEAVDDDACVGSPSSSWSFQLPRVKVPVLAQALGFPAARFLEVFGKNADGRVTMVRLVAPGGKARAVRGFEFRQAASRLFGWASVRSTVFSVAETKTHYVLTGRGTGHGAGLCQVGAIERARRGESRDAILSHYYRGTTITRLEDIGKKPVASTAAASAAPVLSVTAVASAR
jgi:stage II sporulation protein D